MADKPLLLSIEEDTARITLNRPRYRNALSIELSDMLVDAIQTLKIYCKSRLRNRSLYCAGVRDAFRGFKRSGKRCLGGSRR